MSFRMTDEDFQVIADLRRRGCVVVVFTPEELQGAGEDDVEDSLVEKGWEIIDHLRDPDWKEPSDAEEFALATIEEEQ